MSGAGILASSKHKAAAQAFLSFIVSRQGQEIIAHSDSYEYPIGSGVTTAQPLMPWDQLQPAPLTISELGDGSQAIALEQQARTDLTALANPRRHSGRLLIVISMMVAGFLLLPLGYLVVQASQDGWSQLHPVLFRHLTQVLLWNTLRLTVIVTIACGVIGTAVAWLIERTDLPGRRIFAVLAVLPIAVPRFVLGSEWASVFPQLHGLWGATLVMSLALYPLVYLPVAAGLRSVDPGMEEMGLSLGLTRIGVFLRVTLRQVRPALAGGSLLVALAILAEYGAFEALRFQTFTTEIFSQFTDEFDTSCSMRAVVGPRARSD